MKQKNIPTSYAFLKCFLPKELQGFFQIIEIKEYDEEMRLKLEECNIPPKEIKLQKGEKIISKGFCKPIELQDFPIRDKKTWLTIYRRKWVIEGKEGTITRNLDLHPAGMKTTYGFAAFLKEIYRKVSDEYRAGCGIPGVTREEAVQMVQGDFK